MSRTYTPPPLEPNRKYVWRIVAISKKPNGAPGGRMESPIWVFHTGIGGGVGGNNPPFMLICQILG